MRTMKKEKTMKKLKTAFVFIAFVLIMGVSIKAEAADVEAPTDLKQIDANTSGFTLQWNAVSGAEKYLIEVSSDKNNWVQKNIASETKCSVDDLSKGAFYWVRVRVSGTDAVSEPIQAITSPGDVENARQVDATTNSITLQWNKVAGATGYIVFANIDSELVKVAQTANNKVKITTGVKEGDNNYYYVYCYKISDAGYIALELYGYDYVSRAKTLPKKISGLKESAWHLVNKKLTCVWNKNYNVDGYQVQIYNRNKKAIRTVTKSYSNFSADFKNITPNSYYYGRVRGYVTINGVKKYGSWSSYVCLVPQAKVKTLKVSGNKLKIAWNKVSGASGYDVYVSTTSSLKGYKKVKSANAKTRSCSISKIGKTKVSKSKTYYVSILTKKKVGKKTLRAKQLFYNQLYYTYK